MKPRSRWITSIRRVRCARCGTSFECGSGGRDGGCWCMDEVCRMAVPDAAEADCLCPACLRAAASASGRATP